MSDYEREILRAAGCAPFDSAPKKVAPPRKHREKWSEGDLSLLIRLYNSGYTQSDMERHLAPYDRYAIGGQIFRLRRKGILALRDMDEGR